MNIQRLRAALASAALTSLALAPALAADHHMAAKSGTTVVEVAAGNEAFTTLVAAVKAADLVGTLNGDGPFTVFAPVNAAFDALPAGTVESLLKPENKKALQTVLTYHVVSGTVKAGDLVRMIRENDGTAEVTTVEGTTLKAMIKSGDVVLMDAAGNTIKVVNTNIEASNGVVHVIDGVLLPTAG